MAMIEPVMRKKIPCREPAWSCSVCGGEAIGSMPEVDRGCLLVLQRMGAEGENKDLCATSSYRLDNGDNEARKRGPVTISGNENKLRQSRLVFCAVCGMRWYRAGDYRGEVCIECYKWGLRQMAKWLPRGAGEALSHGGTVIVQHNGTVQWMNGGEVYERQRVDLGPE